VTDWPGSTVSGRRRRLPVALVVLALALVAGVGAGVVAAPYTSGADPTPSPTPSATTSSPTPSATPAATASPTVELPRAATPLALDEFVVPRGKSELTRLYRVKFASPVSPQRLVTPAGDRVNSPTLSSDRRTLIYVDRTKGRLRTVGVDGKRDRQLFDGLPSRCDEIGHVSWSRVDPTVLVIRCTSAAGPARLMVIDLTGAVIRNLEDGHAKLDDPVISPDGQTVAYWASDENGRAGGGIYTRDISGGGKPVRLTSDTVGRDADPAWSPDGSRIAFRRRVAPDNLDVYTMASNGTDVRRVVSGPAVEEKPLFSPDGTKLMFISNRGKDGQPGTTSDLFLVSVNGGKPKPLGLSAEEISTPVWSSR
jgi:Tol biopolymer transport system component